VLDAMLPKVPICHLKEDFFSSAFFLGISHDLLLSVILLLMKQPRGGKTFPSACPLYKFTLLGDALENIASNW